MAEAAERRRQEEAAAAAEKAKSEAAAAAEFDRKLSKGEKNDVMAGEGARFFGVPGSTTDFLPR